jgi:hypothetical protein
MAMNMGKMRVSFLLLLNLGGQQLGLHFLFDILADQFGLLLNYVSEIFVVDLVLEGIIEFEELPIEGIVEFIAIVNPTLGNHWNLVVEEFV